MAFCVDAVQTPDARAERRRTKRMFPIASIALLCKQSTSMIWKGLLCVLDQLQSEAQANARNAERTAEYSTPRAHSAAPSFRQAPELPESQVPQALLEHQAPPVLQRLPVPPEHQELPALQKLPVSPVPLAHRSPRGSTRKYRAVTDAVDGDEEWGVNRPPPLRSMPPSRSAT